MDKMNNHNDPKHPDHNKDAQKGGKTDPSRNPDGTPKDGSKGGQHR